MSTVGFTEWGSSIPFTDSSHIRVSLQCLIPAQLVFQQYYTCKAPVKLFSKRCLASMLFPLSCSCSNLDTAWVMGPGQTLTAGCKTAQQRVENQTVGKIWAMLGIYRWQSSHKSITLVGSLHSICLKPLLSVLFRD